MIIKLNVKSSIVEEPGKIMLPVEEFPVTFYSEIYDLKMLRVFVKIGQKSKTFCLDAPNATIDLSDFICAGVLEMEVLLVANGETVKRWQISPVIIKETDQPWWEECQEIEAIKQKLDELDGRMQLVEEKTSVIM